jgi:glycosyltransferase involved in cell wall biosynthesis
MEEFAHDHPGIISVYDCRAHSITNAAVARNTGLRHASKSLICFLDGDIEINADFVHQAADCINSGTAGMVTGPLREHRFNQDYSQVLRILESRRVVAGRQRIFHCGGNFLLDSKVARRIGWWNEQLIINEDFDYTLRVSRLTKCIPLAIPMGTHLTKDEFFRSRALKHFTNLYPMYFGYLLRTYTLVHPRGVLDLLRYSPIGTCGFIVLFLCAISIVGVSWLKVSNYWSLVLPLGFALLDMPRCALRGQSLLSRLALNYAAAPLVLLGLVFDHPSFRKYLNPNRR